VPKGSRTPRTRAFNEVAVVAGKPTQAEVLEEARAHLRKRHGERAEQILDTANSTVSILRTLATWDPLNAAERRQLFGLLEKAYPLFVRLAPPRHWNLIRTMLKELP